MPSPQTLYQQIAATRPAAPLTELREDLEHLQTIYPGIDIQFVRQQNPSAGLPLKTLKASYALAPDIYFVPEHHETGKPALRLRQTSSDITRNNDEVARVARAARMGLFLPAWERMITQSNKRVVHGLPPTDQRFFILVQAYCAIAGHIAGQNETPYEAKEDLPRALTALLQQTDLERERRAVISGAQDAKFFSRYLQADALDKAFNATLGRLGNASSLHAFLGTIYGTLKDKTFFTRWYEQARNGNLLPALYTEVQEMLVTSRDMRLKNYMRHLQAQAPELAAAETKLFAHCVDQNPRLAELAQPTEDAAPPPRGAPAGTEKKGELVELSSAAPAAPGKRFGEKGRMIDGAPYFYARIDARTDAELGSGPEHDSRSSIIAMADEGSPFHSAEQEAAATGNSGATVLDMKIAGGALQTRTPSIAQPTARDGTSKVVALPGAPASRPAAVRGRDSDKGVTHD